MDREVLQPRISGSTVPMLDAFGDGDDRAGCERHSRFAPFLIPAATTDANEHLYCAVVYMPVVTAARLKGHIRNATCIGLQVAVTHKILRVSGVRLSLWPFGLQQGGYASGFGEVATFAGALFGIDYTYKIKKSHDHHPPNPQE